MDSAVGQPNLTIKVKFGDSLRRFGAFVDGNSINLNMSVLREKIIKLFKLNPDAELLLTYTDIDGDLVTLDNDDELCDAVIHQHLNPLRINVHVNDNNVHVNDNAEKSGKMPDPTPNAPSEFQRQPSPKCLISESLKYLPEPLHGQLQNVLSMVPHDILSQSAAAVPALSKIIEGLSKLGQSSSDPSNFHSASIFGDTSSSQRDGRNTNTGSLETPVDLLSGTLYPDANSADQVPKSDLKRQEAGRLSQGSATGVSSSLDTCVWDPTRGLEKQKEDPQKGKSVRDDASASLPVLGPEQNFTLNKPSITETYTSSTEGILEQCNTKRCPYGLTSGIKFDANNNSDLNRPIRSSSPPVAHSNLLGPWGFSNWGSIGQHEATSRMFHRGVICDGCGIHPIMGPRYKSNVKENYDLCSVCFSHVGNEADYRRIDRPEHQHTRSLREKHMSRVVRRYGMGSSRVKLESRFIQDVTILDGTVMAPSTPFTKIWKMRNSGPTSWPKGTQLLWIGGDQFADRNLVELEIPMNGFPAGQEIDIAVDFIAPSRLGRYVSYWRLSSPTGQRFGQRVWVLIQVEEFGPYREANALQADLNLNLPPVNNGVEGLHTTDVRAEPLEDAQLSGPDYLAFAGEMAKSSEKVPSSGTRSLPSDTLPMAYEEFTQVVPEMSPMSNYPVIDPYLPQASAVQGTSISSYPTVDLSPPIPPPCPPITSLPDPLIPVADFFPAFPPFPIIGSMPNSPLYTTIDSLLISTPAPAASAPISGSLIDGNKSEDSSAIVPPVSNASVSVSASHIDVEEAGSSTPIPPVVLAASDSPSTALIDDYSTEAALMKELESMGFKQVDLNKEVLRLNDYNLEQSLNDLCGVSEWDPLLEELEEMGFYDKEMNKKLLIKNGGSIKRVVLDLIAGENSE